VEEITDEENQRAWTLLNKIQNTWNISPTEVTVGPLQGEEEDTVIESFNFENSTVTKYDNYYNVKFYKINLKTNIYVQTTGYKKNQNKKGVDFDVIVGRNGKFKIKEPFFAQPLTDVEDYTKFDTYYIVAYHVTYSYYSLRLVFNLSNTLVNIAQIYKIIGITVGVVFGTICLICFLCICCRSDGCLEGFSKCIKGCCGAIGWCFGSCCTSSSKSSKNDYVAPINTVSNIATENNLHTENMAYHGDQNNNVSMELKSNTSGDTKELNSNRSVYKRNSFRNDDERELILTNNNEYQYQDPPYNYNNNYNNNFNNGDTNPVIRTAEWRRQQREANS
jgi:hypothetical protein